MNVQNYKLIVVPLNWSWIVKSRYCLYFDSPTEGGKETIMLGSYLCCLLSCYCLQYSAAQKSCRLP